MMDGTRNPHNLITLSESKAFLLRINEKIEDGFMWLDDILAVCKKSFTTPGVQLLPKTPARKKQPARKVRQRVAEEEQEEDDNFIAVRTLTFDQQEEPQSYRLRPRAGPPSCSTRVTRSTKTAPKKGENKENTAPGPILDLMKMSSIMLPDAQEPEEAVVRKTEHSSDYLPDKDNGCSVRQRAQAYEAMLSSRVSSSPVVSPQVGGCKEKEVKNGVINSPQLGGDASRRSSCAGHRKSLKVLASKARLHSLHGHPGQQRPRSSITQSTGTCGQDLQSVSAKSTSDREARVGAGVMDQPKTSRTRLRLNKVKLPSNAVSRTSKSSDCGLEEQDKESEPQTDTGLQANDDHLKPLHGTKRKKTKSGSLQDDVTANPPISQTGSPTLGGNGERRMQTRTKVRKIENQDEPAEESVFDSPNKVHATKSATHPSAPDSRRLSNAEAGPHQRRNAEVSSPVDSSSADDSGVSCMNTCSNTTQSAQGKALDTETDETSSQADMACAVQTFSTTQEEEEPALGASVKRSTDTDNLKQSDSLRRATHVVVKKCAISEETCEEVASSEITTTVGQAPAAKDESQETEAEYKQVEETRMTRTKARKRQAEDKANVSACKKLCTSPPPASQTNMDSASPILSQEDAEHGETDGEDDSDYEDIEPTNPPTKMIRPHSFLTKMRKSSMSRSTGCISVGVTSFLKRNTPPAKPTFKVLQQQKKKELQEKERREQERLSKIDELKKSKVEEQKRKREERMRKVAEMRELRQQKENDLKKCLQEKLQEKLNSTDRMKEDRFREEREKQKQRLKKQLEAEERRRQEDEERMRKILEQQEEKRRHEEFLQRKREHEEVERQQRLKEERRRLEEKQAEVERERQAEQERLRQQELEREREQQKLKEQKEKAAAEERAAREKQELEKKKEREAKIQRDFEKLKEMEQQRLAKMVAYEEEKRREETRLQQIIEQHNRNFQSAVVSIMATTSSAKLPVGQPPHNPDSYPITPRPIRKKSSLENYDIGDLRSDDSTDDDEAPRKKIPSWALGANFKAALINQEYHPPDLDAIFDSIEPPNLNEMFKVKRPRFNKRTSSAVWHSPLHKPL